MYSIDSEEKTKTSYRLLILATLMVAAFFVLFINLYNLQLHNEDTYAAQSESNRTRFLTISGMRGNIYDTNMREMAVSVPVFAISLLAVPAKERRSVADNLAFYLNDETITADDIYETLLANSRQYEAVVIKRLKYDEEGIAMVALLEEHRGEIPYLLITSEPMRSYPFESMFGQCLGYVGKINVDEIAANDEYLVSDWIGKFGLENYYETFLVDGEQIGLKGKNGVQQVMINAKNYPVNSSVQEEPVQGNSLILTVDTDVQRVMDQSLEAVILDLQKTYPECHAGTAVLVNVKTGAVIASSSYPFLNPNDFADGLSKDKYAYYMDNIDRPLLNRAVSGLYAPGSTFKMVTALAGLTTKSVRPEETVNCTAASWVNPRAKCTREHGKINLYQAIAYSCNTYFQEIGYRSGIDAIHDIGSQLGLDKKTGIDLPNEKVGVLPNPAYKHTIFSEDNWEYKWRDYDTFYTSMGQGYNLYTILQLVNYIATIANDGKGMSLHILDKIISSVSGETVYEYEPSVLNDMSVDKQDLSIVQQAMRAVTQSGGTSYSLFKNFPFAVAAKTGTAQTAVKGSDNGVYVAYAPFDDPEVAFACVVEYGQSGGGSGGIVCYNVFSEYFGLNTAADENLLLPNEITPSLDDR